MAKYKFGNMWNTYDNADNFIITTNSYIKNNGALVMGAGIAKQARDKKNGIDKYFGNLIEKECGHLGVYGTIIPNKTKIGLFQVKKHFKNKADLSLIINSMNQLRAYAEIFNDEEIHLNYPGIGNGKLKICEVEPIIQHLPDNVNIWRFESQK